MKNKYLILFLIFLGFAIQGSSQDIFIDGQLIDAEQQPVIYANVVLHSQVDSSIVKVETSDLEGKFMISGVNAGLYFLIASYVGFEDIRINDISLEENKAVKLGEITFLPSAIELETAVISARRAMVEVKADRTVFNVEGTINSAGDNALELLRKAPGVQLDNNDNVSVLSRNGVLFYVDGKRLPLAGEELTNYLRNIPAEQIDRIDIITNPGAKYEAEGNAGIIDVRLKRDKSLGANGTVSGTFSQGVGARGNISVSGNYRNKKLNSFGLLGYADSERVNRMDFLSLQNGFELDEIVRNNSLNENYNFRWGTDFFFGQNHIIGFLVSGGMIEGDNTSFNRIRISNFGNPVDSVLIANNTNERDNDRMTYNLNYRFDNRKQTLNIDADYGRYRNESFTFQPNTYYDPTETNILSADNVSFDTPVEIDIYTFKVDYEMEAGGGRLGFGTKLSQVITDNTFLFSNVDQDGISQLNNFRSNRFEYDERVYAGYINYNRSFGQKWSMVAGLRLEQTDATGDLQAFLPELMEPPVDLNYLSTFPNFGITYSPAREHSFNLAYGRRINRPDYNVLNPFRAQVSELSYQRGNPFLSPEIVNNIELGYTLKYRYNFKLSYSHTEDQITRLIGPDDTDPRAGFISWDNLSDQYIYSFNVSAPVQVTDKWNAYFNLNVGYKDNQADYGDGAIVDVQAFTYNIYQQHTINLPGGYVGEVSGWFSGPGIWGGVFEYDPSYSLNFGLQKKFFNDKMNVRLSVQDVFLQAGWSGSSTFDGLVATGMGFWDSRRGSVSISYNFGSSSVKTARRRTTGLEDEGKRVGEGE